VGGEDGLEQLAEVRIDSARADRSQVGTISGAEHADAAEGTIDVPLIQGAALGFSLEGCEKKSRGGKYLCSQHQGHCLAYETKLANCGGPPELSTEERICG
jgi:hypothetical protein